MNRRISDAVYREHAPAKRKGAALRKRPWVWAFASVFAAAAITAGVLLGSGVFTVKSGTSGVLPPHFTVNNRVYWVHYGTVTKLPSKYKYIGKLRSYGDGNFQVAGPLPIGSKLYMDPSNPNAVYLSNISTYFKGNQVVAEHVFNLYVTQELREGSVYYNGSLYNDYVPKAYSLDGFECVGVIRSVDYVRFPSRQLESNIGESLGCKVYASRTKSDFLYLEQKDGSLVCLKRNFNYTGK